MVTRPALDELGRQVERRAEELARARVLARARDAKVAQPAQVPPVEKDVGGLDVAVQHAVRMQMGQSGADLDKDVEDLRFSKRLIVGAPPIQSLQQRAALRVLLHDVQTAITHECADKPDHVREPAEHHQDLNLAQDLGRLHSVWEALERDPLPAQNVAVVLPSHHPGCPVSPLPEEVHVFKVGAAA